MEKTVETIVENVLYGDETEIVIQGKDCSVFKMANETGEGIITCYPVFDGIQLLYNDIHMSDVSSQNKLPNINVMEINHCREGRFECEFTAGNTAYLGTGDLAINMLSNTTRISWFPLRHYHGVSIVVDLPVATNTLNKLAEIINAEPIDLYEIRNRLCANDLCFIMRAADSIEHIFSELYTAPRELRTNYFKIKVLELLLFLSSPSISYMREDRKYFSRSQAETIRKIKDYMTNNIEQHITLDELSKKFLIPLTSMKLCFKEIYGTSIYSYLYSYRLQVAAHMLKNTDESVTDIAGRVGYKNSSKFSEAFKRNFGVTPMEYRKSKLLSGSSESCLNGVVRM